MTPPYTTWLFWAVTLFVAGIFGWRFLQARGPGPTQAPSTGAAQVSERTHSVLDLLNELRTAAVVDGRNRREHFNRLAIIMRIYLQVTTGLKTLRMTTSEAVDALLQQRNCTIDPGLAQSVLQSCDQARFSTKPLSDDVWIDALDRSFELIKMGGEADVNPILVREMRALEQPVRVDRR